MILFSNISSPVRKDSYNSGPSNLHAKLFEEQHFIEFTNNSVGTIDQVKVKKGQQVTIPSSNGKKEDLVSAKSWEKFNPFNGQTTRGFEYTTKPTKEKKVPLVKFYDNWVRIDDEPLPIYLLPTCNCKKLGRIEYLEFVIYNGLKLFIKKDFWGKKILYRE